MFDRLFLLVTGEPSLPQDDGLAGIYQVEFSADPSPCPPDAGFAGAALDAFYSTYAMVDPSSFSLRVFTAEGAEITLDPGYDDGSLEHLVEDIWRSDEEDTPLFLFDFFVEEDLLD